MRFYRVLRVVYFKTPIKRYPNEWVGTPCELLSEVLSEPGTWTEAYEDFRLAVWALKRSRKRLPSNMFVEIVLHGYTTLHGKKTNPFTIDALVSDNIVKFRDWRLLNNLEVQ